MIERTRDRLGLYPKRLVGDTGYGSAEMLGWLVEEQGIEPHIPVLDKSHRKDQTFSRSAFAYDHRRDAYQCPAGKWLHQYRRPFKTPRDAVDEDGLRRYRASKLDCEVCDLKYRCTLKETVPEDHALGPRRRTTDGPRYRSDGCLCDFNAGQKEGGNALRPPETHPKAGSPPPQRPKRCPRRIPPRSNRSKPPQTGKAPPGHAVKKGELLRCAATSNTFKECLFQQNRPRAGFQGGCGGRHGRSWRRPIRGAALDGLDADLADLKDGLYDALIGALEEWDAFTPSWVEAAPENPSAIAALRYSANVFQFLGRDDEEADLDAFLFEPGPGGRLAPFRWVTLTGEGGLGKTRLAYEFVQVMPDGWAGGLLREADLRSLTDKARWRPKQPTLFVIDYPGRFPKPVGQFLGYLQRSAKDFDLPVRVLLLERDGTGPWRDTIYDAGGASLANLVWRAAEHESGWPLGPVHPEKLIASMRARFQGQDLMPPPDDVLMPMLFQVDGGLVQTEDHFKPTRLPRPLFAAAIAEIGIRRMQEAVPGEAIEPAAVFDGVDRDQVLEAIISRDRRLRWQEAAADQAVLDAHENLLALATFCRGFDLASLNGIAKPLADHLPSHTPSAPIPLNRALLDAMTRIDAAGELAPLEPDILGERHLLDRLDELRQASTAEAFLDAGYALAGLQAPYTAILTLRDHTARFAKAGYFFPGVQCTLPAARAFAAAAMDHIGKLGDAGAWDQIESLLAHLDALRQDARFAGDREIALAEAKAAFNVTSHAAGCWALGRCVRCAGADRRPSPGPPLR